MLADSEVQSRRVHTQAATAQSVLVSRPARPLPLPLPKITPSEINGEREMSAGTRPANEMAAKQQTTSPRSLQATMCG